MNEIDTKLCFLGKSNYLRELLIPHLKDSIYIIGY
jgi:hypothetical protein